MFDIEPLFITPNDATMPADLVAALMEHSPRLAITGVVLIRHADSPTGWLVVESEE